MAEKNALMADAEKCQNKLNMAQRHLGLVEFSWEFLIGIRGDFMVVSWNTGLYTSVLTDKSSWSMQRNAIEG